MEIVEIMILITNLFPPQAASPRLHVGVIIDLMVSAFADNMTQIAFPLRRSLDLFHDVNWISETHFYDTFCRPVVRKDQRTLVNVQCLASEGFLVHAFTH